MKALSLGTFVIVAVAVLAMLDPNTGLRIWLELRRDLAVSNVRVERLVRENNALRGEIETLEREPAAVDRAIREELDLVLPGEVVVRFEPSATTLRDDAGPDGGAGAASVEGSHSEESEGNGDDSPRSARDGEDSP